MLLGSSNSFLSIAEYYFGVLLNYGLKDSHALKDIMGCLQVLEMTYRATVSVHIFESGFIEDSVSGF